MPRRASRLPLAAALMALALAACGGAGPTPRPSPTATVTPTPPSAETPTPPPAETPTSPTPPAPTKVPGGGERTPAPSPGTFETAWGEAWDALPPGFPIPPGAEPADPADPAEGPVSGAFVVDRSPDDTAARQQVALAAAGYSTEALSGPSEDGSLVIDSVGTDPACRVQTRIRELGGTTMITVLFGAACPWD